MSFTEHRHENGLVWLTADNLRSKHAFMTKLGGASTGTFAGLNLSVSCGDAPESVRENYRLLGEALGIDAFSMVRTYQVHGTGVRVTDSSDVCELYGKIPYRADGLVTTERGLPILAMTADCVPVLMEDRDCAVVAAVHCGWRGTVADILAVAVEQMRSLGAETDGIRVAIGPSIGSCCFETGPEVPEAVNALLGAAGERFSVPEPGVPGKFLVDLRGVCRERLTQLGVPYNNIAVSDECTVCQNQKYWSHRATRGVRGIQANIITL